MMEIVRGTTPTLTFGLPFEASTIATGFVTVQQNNKTLIDKPLADCVCNDKDLSVTLTQKETLGLSCCYYAEVALVVKTKGDERLETKPIKVKVVDTSKEGVI